MQNTTLMSASSSTSRCKVWYQCAGWTILPKISELLPSSSSINRWVFLGFRSFSSNSSSDSSASLSMKSDMSARATERFAHKTLKSVHFTTAALFMQLKQTPQMLLTQQPGQACYGVVISHCGWSHCWWMQNTKALCGFDIMINRSSESKSDQQSANLTGGNPI